MSMISMERLMSPATNFEKAVAKGHSFIVQIEPDLISGERINVGVGVISSTGKRYARFLSDFSRLECLYGAETVGLIEALADFARVSVLTGDELSSQSIFTSNTQPFYNIEPEEYVEKLYYRVVPAGIIKKESAGRAKNRDTDTLWKQVADIIKLRIPNQAEQIIASTPFTKVNTIRGIREVCVPLTPVGGAGALESADFSIETTRLKLMKAVLDMETAAVAKNIKNMGLFIARPLRVRKDIELKGIDAAIDFVATRAPINCRVEVESDAEVLAEKIIDWADLKAA